MFHNRQDPDVSGDVTHPLGAKDNGMGIAFAQNQRNEVREMEVAGALASQPGAKQQTYAKTGMQVRRLTPRECERLQGFPDDYTLIPGGNRTDDEDYAETVEYLIASGWPVADAMALADTPDGPRYKAIGNSMAVPVMRWIGERIAMVEKEISLDICHDT